MAAGFPGTDTKIALHFGELIPSRRAVSCGVSSVRGNCLVLTAAYLWCDPMYSYLWNRTIFRAAVNAYKEDRRTSF